MAESTTMSDIANKTEQERQFRKIANLKLSRYIDTINGQQVDCEPSPEDSRKAMDDTHPESRHYHDNTLVLEWKASAGSIEEWGGLVRATTPAELPPLLQTNAWTQFTSRRTAL